MRTALPLLRPPLLPSSLLLLVLFSGACSAQAPLEVRELVLQVEQQAPVPVVLPAHLDAHLPRRAAQYRLFTIVSLPESWRGQSLDLAIPFFQGKTALRAGGRPVRPVHDEVSDGYRPDRRHHWRLPPEITRGHPLPLELTIEHRWTQSGWMDTVPQLSPTAWGTPRAVLMDRFNAGSAATGLGLFLAVGVTYLFLFLLDRRLTAYGLFGLHTLLVSSYHLTVLGLSQHLLGQLDVPFLAVGLCGGAILTVHVTHEQFGLGRASLLWGGLMLGVLGAAVVAADPFRSTHVLGLLAALVVGAVMVFQMVRLGRLARSRSAPANAVTLLLAWSILFLACLPDLGYWLGAGALLGGAQTACAGLIVFSLLHSAALSRDHLVARFEAERLNAELQGRVDTLETQQREIVSLNEELRRQIGDRSQRLGDALLRLEGGPTMGQRWEELLPLPGDLVDGRYRVERVIGSGGMGRVYAVTRLGDQRRLALKVLSGGQVGFAMTRFAREANFSSQVAHPNVVAVVDFGIATRGFLYLVMEHIEGQALSQQKKRYGDLAFALDVLGQVARGLAAIHARGIVHRDLKPGNVLLEEKAGSPLRAAISDFGVSTLLGPAHPPAEGSATPPQATLVEPPLAVADTVATPAPAARRAGATAIDDETGTTRAAGWRGHAMERVEGEADDALEDDEPFLPAFEGGPAGAAADSGPASPALSPGASPSASGPLTRAGTLVGTPRYMAPELVEGPHRAQPPADLFSLGVIAFELLTRRRPFSESPVFARAKGRFRRPPPLRDRCPGLPAGVAELLDACLSLDPAERPTAAQLGEHLPGPRPPGR